MRYYRDITYKYLNANKKRTVFTIIGLILSLSLISGVAFLGLSLRDYLYNNAIENMGNCDAVFLQMSTDNINILKNNVDVDNISLNEYIGDFTNKNIDKENYISIIAYDKNAMENCYSFSIIEGRNAISTDEIVLEERCKNTFDVSLDDEISLDKIEYYENGEIVSNEIKKYKIVGFKKNQYSNSSTYYEGITFLDEINNDENYNVSFSLIGRGDKFEKITNLADQFGAEYNINSQLLNLQGYYDDNASIIAIVLVILFVLLIIVIATIFLIYNDINISVTERSKHFGILRSIGATPKQIRSIVFREGIIMCLFALPFGIFFGYIGVWITVKILGDKITSLLGEGLLAIRFNPIVIIFTIVLGIITILISSYGPAKKAGKINVISSIKGTNESSSIKHHSGKVVRRILGVEGWLAYKNIRKNSKRFIVTILSLSISLTMFITFTSLNEKRTNELSYMQHNSIVQGEIYSNVESYEDINSELGNIVGKENVFYWLQEDGILPINNYSTTEEFKEYWGEYDSDYYYNIYCYSDTALKNIGIENALKEDEIVLINNITINDYNGKLVNYDILNYKEGDTINIPVNSLDITFDNYIYDEEGNRDEGQNINSNDYITFKIKKIIDNDIFSYNYNYHLGIIVNENIIADYYGESDVDPLSSMRVGVRFPDSNNEEEVVEISKEIEEYCSESGIYFYNNVEEAREDEEKWTVINVFIYGFITLVTLIGVINIFNTISLNILTKKTEYSTLQVIGMEERQISKLIIFEGLIYGIISSIIGGFISFILIKVVMGIVMYGYTVDSNLYIMPFAVGIISDILVVLISTLIPLSKVKKMGMVNGIGEEELGV